VSLKRLYMESNQLQDLPIFLKDCSLEEFRAQKNNIVRIPEALYSLIKKPIFSKSVFTAQKGFVWPYRTKSQIHRVRMQKFFADAKPEDCKGMYTLDVSELGWTVLPKTICQITTIHHLNLAGNQLTTLPKEMEQLTNLMTLNVRDNHLKELPRSLGTMKRLQKLFAGGNQISEFPSFLLHCTQLVQLNLSCNLLSEIPYTIWAFPSLSICVLKDNQILDFPDPLEPISQQWENINLKGNPIKKHFDIPFIRM
jgi:leucine-rich repeat protein SHOC2